MAMLGQENRALQEEVDKLKKQRDNLVQDRKATEDQVTSLIFRDVFLKLLVWSHASLSLI